MPNLRLWLVGQDHTDRPPIAAEGTDVPRDGDLTVEAPAAGQEQARPLLSLPHMGAFAAHDSAGCIVRSAAGVREVTPVETDEDLLALAGDMRRRIAPAVHLMFGYELNAFTWRTRTKMLDDSLGLEAALVAEGVRLLVVVNAVYQARWQTKVKRRALSESIPNVVAVWNRRAVGEPQYVWSYFRGGLEASSSVRLVEASRVQVGILDVPI